MTIRSKRGWELPESAATPEDKFRKRRELVKALAAGPLLAAAGFGLAGYAEAATGLYPAKRNPRYRLDRAVTDEKIVTTYNNFYEFGSHKQIWKAAQKLKTRPWTVTVDGMVEKPFTIDAEALIRKMPLEERLYRHRCVEAWSIAVPWSGFALEALVAMARPSAGAKYLEMRGFHDASVATGQRQVWYPWPYLEALTIEEATNELAFIATGAYGKPMPKQNGAPLRLAVPWKYGFKSIKSITRFTPSPTSARSASGRRSRATNTASGPTSIPRSTTRAGARRPSASWAPASASPPCSTTATRSRSPTSTRT